MSHSEEIVIIGAGPTGLGAAGRLQELHHPSWVLCEAAGDVGGLASSVVDAAGFTWDFGGHVLFSHYRYFDGLMQRALGDQWVEHVREAWVWMRERFIPYPLQNNIWRLPAEDLWRCLEGLLEVGRDGQAGAPPKTFREWLLRSFGLGLCETFMFPYNRKVWAYDPAELNAAWMAERVATVDLRAVLRNLALRQDEVGWGPNSTFRFPARGGTGAIWRSLARQLPPERLELGRQVVAVDGGKRTVYFGDGGVRRYDRLLSSIPLDVLLRSIRDRPDLAPLADQFLHSSSHIIGVGLEGQPPPTLRTKCWIYFPEATAPFYRATVFSNYSPHNVPDPDRHWSLLAEVSESPRRPVDAQAVVAETVQGLRRCGLLDEGSRIVSLWHRRLEHGYPTPWLGRDEVLNRVQPELQAMGIWSRGRFGAWKYEVSNQDHSVMQGVWAVEEMLAVERTES